METIASGQNLELVATQRFNGHLIQLIHDDDTHAYYLHHRHCGHLLLWDYISEDEGKATDDYHKFVKSVRETLCAN